MSDIVLKMGGEYTGDSYMIVPDWIDRNGVHIQSALGLVIKDDLLIVSYIDQNKEEKSIILEGVKI